MNLILVPKPKVIEMCGFQSVSTFDEWVKRGDFPEAGGKIGKSPVWHINVLENWCEKFCTIRPTTLDAAEEALKNASID